MKKIIPKFKSVSINEGKLLCEYFDCEELNQTDCEECVVSDTKSFRDLLDQARHLDDFK